jgi:hypothetical protein
MKSVLSQRKILTMRKRLLILCTALIFGGISTSFGQDSLDNSWKTYPSDDLPVDVEDDTTKAHADTMIKPVITMIRPSGEGKAQLFVPARIDKYSEAWLTQGERPGFRIQIYLGQSSSASKSAKTNFMYKFDDESAYRDYDSPNFKVLVGDFRTRLAAEGYLEKLKARYPGAYVVPSLIRPVRLD